MEDQENINDSPAKDKAGTEQDKRKENQSTADSKKDPSTWPAGDSSLEELLEEDENQRKNRGGEDHGGKDTTVGNP